MRRIFAGATIAFGAFIAATSALGIYLGFQAFNGWLAILYGLLGVSMGVAGIGSVVVKQPLHDALLGWFLVGIASRAILEGLSFFVIGWFVSFLIAALLLAALALELRQRPSATGTLYALGAGALSVLSLVALAFVAPTLPALCPPAPAEGTSVFAISYPGSTFPWDSAELKYIDKCL